MMKKSQPKTDVPHTSRRQFARTIAGAIIAAPLVSGLAVQAQPPAKPKEPAAPPNPQPSPTPAPAPSPVAVAYAEVARAAFGQHLTPEELERVKRDLEGNVRTADRLRAVKLKNSDEPDFTFNA